MISPILSKTALFVGFLAAPVHGNPAGAHHPIFELQAVLDPGRICTLRPTEALPIFDTRAAKRTLATLQRGEPVTILAIDRFGFKVRGMGQNGPLTGWIGQKGALDNDTVKLKTVAAFYERQIKVEKLIGQKRPAIGMTLHELSRIFGTATSHNIVAEGAKRNETAVWVMNQKVDLNDTLDLGTDSALLKVDVETGRITVGLINGVANSIDMNIAGVAGEIPSVPNPIKTPFRVSVTDPQS